MPKPVVFISHITQETKLATLIQEHIEETFIGQIEVFVSSDGKSIQPGTRWLNTISANLQAAEVMLVLCSTSSIKRPWINFEAGAAWVKDIHTVPVCHTNLTRDDLPIPLNQLQGINAAIEIQWHGVYEILANKISAKRVNPDFAKLVAAIKDFEKEYSEILKKDDLPQPAQAAPSRGSPADLALAAIKDTTKERAVLISRYMEWLVSQLDSLNPDFGSGKRAQDLLLAALDQTIPLVIEFAKLAQETAQLNDEEVSEAIYSGLEPLLERYDGSAEKPFATHHVNGQYFDYDFYRFMGHELLVTFVSFLVKERRWTLLDKVLARGFYITNGANAAPRIEQFPYASQKVTLLSKEAKPFEHDFLSPHSHLLEIRHRESAIAKAIPAQQFTDADLLLFLRSNSKSYKTRMWYPWGILHQKQRPRYMMEAENERGAKQLLTPLDLPDLAALRGQIERCKEEYRELFPGRRIDNALMNLDPMKIGFS